MRDFLGFVLFVLAIAYGLGEWRGWAMGIPSQTPVLAYKADHVATAARRTINVEQIPIEVKGKVRHGEVELEVVHEVPSSFQTMTPARAPRVVFEETYRAGQRIAIDEIFDHGHGIYTVRLTFREGSGVFSIALPTNAAL